jgi:hypothetical protein
VARLLGRDELPRVPSQGNGGSGEILALGHLFGPMGRTLGLEEKEGNALVNGSPCGAALLADGALAAAGRLGLVYEARALSVEAFAAPLEAYDPELAGLWGTRVNEDAAAAGLAAGGRAMSARVTRPRSAASCARVNRPSSARGRAARPSSLVGDGQPGLPPALARAPARARVQHRRLPQRHGVADGACADGRLRRPLPSDPAASRLSDGPARAIPAVEELLGLLLMVTTGGRRRRSRRQPPIPRGPVKRCGAPAFWLWR